MTPKDILIQKIRAIRYLAKFHKDKYILHEGPLSLTLYERGLLGHTQVDTVSYEELLTV